MKLDRRSPTLFDDSMEFLQEHIGQDVRLVFDVDRLWHVDCVGYPQRTTLSTAENVYDACMKAVQRFYELHPVDLSA